MNAERPGRGERRVRSLSDAQVAQMARDYLLGLVSEDEALRFFEAYRDEIVSRMMRSPESLAGWAEAVGSLDDEQERRAVRERLEAAKAWQRRIMRERRDQG